MIITEGEEEEDDHSNDNNNNNNNNDGNDDVLDDTMWLHLYRGRHHGECTLPMGDTCSQPTNQAQHTGGNVYNTPLYSLFLSLSLSRSLFKFIFFGG